MFLANICGYSHADGVICQKIRKWFYNRFSAHHHRTTRFIQRWSARNVFYHDKRAEVMDLAQEISGGTPGSQAFLGSLQPATTRLWNELSIEEQEQYGETARDWSENAPPNHIQSRQVMSRYYIHRYTNSSSQDGFGDYPRTSNSRLSNTDV